jgi:hypothetical protein
MPYPRLQTTFETSKNMTKPTIHVGLATLTEGPRILQIAAVIGEEVWTKAPTPTTLGEFREWLVGFRSTLIACSSVRDFNLCKDTMIGTIGNFPFGDKLLDVNTWIAAKQNDLRLTRRWGKIFVRPSSVQSTDPVEIAKNRLWAITKGVKREMPFANVPKRRIPSRYPEPPRVYTSQGALYPPQYSPEQLQRLQTLVDSQNSAQRPRRDAQAGSNW